MRPIGARSGLIFGAAVLVFALLSLYSGDTGRFLELTRHGVEARGAVVETICADHDTFRYKFEIGTSSFESIGHDGMATDCASLKPGDPVVVYYLVKDPSVNVSGSPQRLFLGEAMFWVCFLSVIGLGLWASSRAPI